jgi:hypothetical protein
MGVFCVVKAIVDILPQTNMVLNIVKAKNGFSTKSETIDFVVKHYEEDLLEPELRPEYIAKMQRIAKEKVIFVGSVANLRKRYE